LSAWDENRPIFRRLPQYGWQDNEIADAITSAYDQILMELQQEILNFPTNFIDPDTARADALDWLAQLCGYTGEYWDASWTESVKRQLIKDHQMVWANKGTQYLLEYLLNLFGLSDTKIRVRGAWRAGVNKPGDAIGGELLHYSVVIGSPTSVGYQRGGAEWRLIDRLRRLYMPAWCDSIPEGNRYLHYHRFRAGRSAAGDPL
jgi:phage tail P2-like protein